MPPILNINNKEIYLEYFDRLVIVDKETKSKVSLFSDIGKLLLSTEDLTPDFTGVIFKVALFQALPDSYTIFENNNNEVNDWIDATLAYYPHFINVTKTNREYDKLILSKEIIGNLPLGMGYTYQIIMDIQSENRSISPSTYKYLINTGIRTLNTKVSNNPSIYEKGTYLYDINLAKLLATKVYNYNPGFNKRYYSISTNSIIKALYTIDTDFKESSATIGALFSKYVCYKENIESIYDLKVLNLW